MPSQHATATTAAFDAHARQYDGLRRRLIPPFDAFYGNAVDAIALIEGSPKRVLDLGAGTGMLSAMVAERYPEAELVLTDGAAAMLDEARAALPQATIEVADLNDPLPEGPFCAIVSALAIHHLDDEGKRTLFARVHDALSPGGVFVNAEQVLAPTPWLDAKWLEWHRASSAALGTTPEEWEAALGRMAFDRCATVEDQLGWLRDAGFDDVAAPFQDHRFAVMAGKRPRTA
jgi:tRNA (cmo5U34)-methyltransferase